MQDETQPAGSQSASEPWRRAIIYMVWGDGYVQEAARNAASAAFMRLPLVLITNVDSECFIPPDHPFTDIRFVEQFRSLDMRNKSTLWDHLPEEYDSFLYLDNDTVVLKDVSFGFDQAERHGFAASQATSYCLPSHHEFRRVLTGTGLPDAGQLQYNAGVYFFARRPDVQAVFKLFQKSTYKLTEEFSYTNRADRKVDQPFLTYAMEKLNFNPYTLSINYCYRGLDSEPVCGDIRIWHSHFPVPDDVNTFESHRGPRRRYYKGNPVDMRRLYRKLRDS